MLCSACGSDNQPGARFCSACGRTVTAGCPSCGATVGPADRFCAACGSPLAGIGRDGGPAGRSPAGQAAAGGSAVAERRLVSVLFVDIVGFTGWAETRDAEDVRETLGRYFDVASTVIGRHGGTVEKFIGDAVMAVWGAPVAREDDAELAVRAALEVVGAVREVGRDPGDHPGLDLAGRSGDGLDIGQDFAARAGVMTGEAAVNVGAVGQGLVAGDLVNTAARLQAAAPPGAVLVGDATRRAAARAIVFEPAGEERLRGKSAPLVAWRAVRVVAELGGRNRQETLEAPFVGRDAELRLLKDLFHATGREGRARLVSVVGTTGIGKSRLAWELSKYADGLVEDTWWHVGRCPSDGEGTAFWALGEMVRQRAGLLATDDERTTRAGIEAAVREWVPDDSERRWIEPALLALLGVETGATDPQELFGAWRTFFERIAARGMVVLVFEDLHNGDPGLIAFVDHLMEWSRALPLFVLTLARPDLAERHAGFGAGARSFASVHLEPLSDEAMRRLVAGLVPGLPEAGIEAIVGRADGIPLYAVETVRMLIDEGRLVATDGTYQPAEGATSLTGALRLAGAPIPETLTELIAARLDALPAPERRLVADAAVLGQRFTSAALAAVGGVDEGALEALLRSLVRREILAVVADPRSPERGQHEFVQALVREVAYNTLSHRDRAARHLAAARHFEALASAELAGACAGHFLAAYRSTPRGAGADALAAQVLAALRTAAERAMNLGSHDQAITIVEQALEVSDDPVEQAGLLELAGRAASWAGWYGRADGFLLRAIALHRGRGDASGLARATAALGWTRLHAWDLEAALALLEPAAVELRDLGDDPGRLAVCGQLARAYFIGEEPQRAVELADEILGPAERDEVLDVLADALVTKGSALCELGRRREGVAVLRAGLAVAEEADLSAPALRARQNLTGIVFDVDPAEGLRLARENLATTRRQGRRDAGVVFNAAWSAMWLGEWDWALVEVRELAEADLGSADRSLVLGVEIGIGAWRGADMRDRVAEFDRLAAEFNSPGLLASVPALHAFVDLASGELDRAARAALDAVVMYPAEAIENCRVAGHAAAWHRDAAGVRKALDVLKASNRGGGRVMVTAGTTLRAGLDAFEGRTADALDGYRAALRSWRDLGLVVDEAFTAIDMATLIDLADPAVGAGTAEIRAAVERAREILVPLRAQPFLDRLEAAPAASVPVRPGA